MKILELPVSELKTALAGFNKIVNSRSSLPVLGCIRVQPEAHGVALQVTDLDSFAMFRMKADAPADFPPCLLSLANLAKIAKTAKDRLLLVYEGEQRLKIRHFIGDHPVEQPIDSLPIGDWPPSPQINAKPIVVEPGFKQAFRNAMECASAESSRLILNGVCLDVTNPECHCLVATDGRHLFSANTFHFPVSESAVIPNCKFLNWSGFAEDGDWLLAMEPPVEGAAPKPAYIRIQSEHWTFTTRGIAGQYPNWRQVAPSSDREFTHVKLAEQDVDVILDALPRMPGSDDSGQPVTVVLRAAQLILRSPPRPSDQGAEIPVPGAVVTGSDQRVCLDRHFITKALRFGFTELEVQDPLSPVVFTGPGRKLIVMPLRLQAIPARAHPDNEPTVQSIPPSPQEAATPTEATPAASRPPLEPDNPTDQNIAMTTNNITTLPAPQRGNIKTAVINVSNGEGHTAFKAVVDQVEKIKTNLRDVISDLSDALDLLKAAEKEKKATLKEVESVRATLRSLQKMEL